MTLSAVSYKRLVAVRLRVRYNDVFSGNRVLKFMAAANHSYDYTPEWTPLSPITYTHTYIHTSFIIFPHGGFSKTIWYNTTIKY